MLVLTSSSPYIPKNTTKILINSIPDYMTELPPVTEVYFDHKYNDQLCIGFFPQTILSIKFGNSFDKYIGIGVFNDGLSELEFGTNFNQKFDEKVLPQSLNKLVLGRDYDQCIDHVLPENLRVLSFGDAYAHQFTINSFPPNLTHIVLPDINALPFESNILPASLKSLHVGRYFNNQVCPGMLPPNLESITFGTFFNGIIDPDGLPDTIKDIFFGNLYTGVLEPESIPSSTENIYFTGHVRHEMLENIPTYINIYVRCRSEHPSFAATDISNYTKFHKIHVYGDAFALKESVKASIDIEIIDEYIHPILSFVSVIINTKYYSYPSRNKSANNIL